MIGIYGSNGFIGRHLVRRLSFAGVPTRAVSRRQDPEFMSGIAGSVEFLEADLGDPLAMAASLQDIDTVVQMVSTSSPGLKNDHAIADLKDNVLPQVKFLQTCVRAGVRRYIFLSSGGTVYGPDAAIPTPETAAVNPICSHGLTKLFVEKYIQMHGHVDGLEYLVLRLANPYGPGQEYRKGQGLIPAIIDRHRRGLPIRIFGGGQARRDYVYIDDVIDALELAIQKQGRPQLVLNIGSGETRSVVEVIEAVEDITNISLEREYVDARETDVDVSCLEIAQARADLDWIPTTPFRIGLEHALQFTDRPVHGS